MAGVVVALVAILGASAQPRAQPFWEHFLRVSEFMALPEARLLLFRLDVNGDGRPEIFIAPEEKCGNGGCPWFVYSPRGRHGALRYLGEVDLSVAGYRFAHGVITLCWHMSAAECSWGQYRFEGYKMTQLPGRTCRWGTDDSSWCDAELKAIQEWQRQAPEVLLGTLPDSGKTLGIQWTTRSMKPVVAKDLPPLDAAVVARSPR